MKNSDNKFTIIWQFILLSLFLLQSSIVLAEVSTTILRPDGTKEINKTTYYPPAFEYAIIGVAVFIGGIIAYLGIKVILHAFEQGYSSNSAEIDVSLKNRQIKIKKITQGSLVVLVGATIMLGSIYIMRN